MSNYVTQGAKIELLNNVADWLTWRIQMEAFLWEVRVWDYLSGKKKKPEVKDEKDVGEVKAVADLEEMDWSTYNTIIMHTGKRVINQLQNTRTSHQAWQKLKGKFQAKGITRVIEIQWKLLHAVFTKEEDIDDWLDQMSMWHEEFVGPGRSLQEDEFSLTLLMALPKSEQAANSNSHVLMIASQGKGKGCYKCGKEGHIKRDCPQKKKGGKGKGKKQEKEKEKEKDRKRGSSWVLTNRQKRTKLDPKSKAMLFMGMADGSKVWKFYDPHARQVGKSRNIIFAVPRRIAPANDDDFNFIEIQAPTTPAQEDVPAGETPWGSRLESQHSRN
ncbi:hypothetical protein C8Q74DRAFT_1372755 [Fomes fomentarius]|nr:hypothetical protein C8Q74DRAFT_1372755 [Fomes fomentarius]